MNAYGLIDVVITNDSDVLHQRCRPNSVCDEDYVSVYAASHVAEDPIALSSPQMILIVLLTGADYDTEVASLFSSPPSLQC